MTSMVGLYVEFKAKTDSVDKAFSKMETEGAKVVASQNRISNAIGSSISTTAQLATSFVKLGATIGLVAAGSALALFNALSNIGAGIDKITDSSRGLGVAAADLQEMAYAADLSGVSFESLENLIKKMNVNISQGTDKTKDALKSLGLSFNDLSKLSAPEQLDSILFSLSRIDDKAKQNAISFTLFGKSMKDALSLSRDGYTKNLDEFGKLGLAITDTQRSAVDAFGDSQTRLGAIWQGFTQKVVAYVAEPFEKMITWISETIIQMGGIDKAAQAFASAIVSGVQFAVNAIQSLVTGIDGLYARMLKLKIFALETANSAPDPFAVTKALGEKYGILQQGGAADRQLNRSMVIQETYKELNTVEKKQAQKEDFFKPLQDLLSASKANIGVLESYIPPIKMAADNTSKFADALDLGTKKINDSISQMLATRGESKLQSLIGTDSKTGLPAVDQQVVGQWDTAIQNIYKKALAGEDFADSLGKKTTATEDLNRLSQSVADSTNSGNAASLADYIGAISELKVFVEKMDKSNQANKLDITVKTTEGFNLEIAQSPEMTKQINTQINTVAQNAARMGAR